MYDMYCYILPEITIVIIAVAVCNKTNSGGEIAPHIITHGEVTE